MVFVSLALDPHVHHQGAVGLSDERTLVLGGWWLLDMRPLNQDFVLVLPAFYAHKCILQAILGVHGWKAARTPLFQGLVTGNNWIRPDRLRDGSILVLVSCDCT